MPYTINELMNRQAEREKQQTNNQATAKTEVMAKETKNVKPPKVKAMKNKEQKTNKQLTPLQQRTIDYASVFATVLVGVLALAVVIRLIFWMFGA